MVTVRVIFQEYILAYSASYYVYDAILLIILITRFYESLTTVGRDEVIRQVQSWPTDTITMEIAVSANSVKPLVEKYTISCSSLRQKLRLIIIIRIVHGMVMVGYTFLCPTDRFPQSISIICSAVFLRCSYPHGSPNCHVLTLLYV